MKTNIEKGADGVDGQESVLEFPAVNAVREFLKKKKEEDIEFSKDVEEAKSFLSKMASLIKEEEMNSGRISFQGKSQNTILQIEISPNGTEDRFFFWRPKGTGAEEVKRRQLLLPADAKRILEMSKMTEIILVRD